jgi:large subunit ribosomal protein L24
MGATLDKALRTKHGMRGTGIRKGDEVKVMRGKFRGKQGKVGSVDVKRTRIQIDGVQRAKMGGEKVETWFHPSNVKIIVLNVEDSRRLKGAKKVEKKEIASTEEKVVKKKTDSKIKGDKK